MGTNKITAAVIALVAICIASFVAVRQLAKGEQINNPTIIANQGEVQQSQSVEPVTESTSESTSESTAVPSTESTLAPSSENVFSTYDISSDISEMPTSIVSTAAPTTALSTTLPPPVTVTTTKTTTGDKYIDEAAKENKGFLGYLYNETGNYYYTNSDPWQRVFGFNAAYDFGAQFVFMFFDTARIKYTYDNKDWMVELWKGQYGAVFIGAEIGVYYKPTDRTVEHYDCVSDDDALYMEMALYRNKNEELLSREYTRYWWCTGFVPGKLKKYSDRSELTVKARITMENKNMLKAFVKGLETCQEFKFVEGKNYRIDGLDVFINW